MTPIQQRIDYANWMSLDGTTLDGAYVLGQCLEADERKLVFKARVKAGQPATAIVKFYRAASGSAAAADEQIALWEAIKALKHPNLLAILGAGRTKLQSEDLLYVAVEPADEILENVLQQRALDSGEAGELVLNICRGLETLHAAGFVHGSLSPEEVFGVGDSIKISTDGVRRAGSATGMPLKSARYRAPESVNGNIAPENDVWCLGATLFEAMTQKECGAECRGEAAKLPVPFATIVHRCLYANPEARCTLPEIVQLYEHRPRAFGAAAGAGAVAGLSAVDSRQAGAASKELPGPAQSEPSQALPSDGAHPQTDYFFPGSASPVARPQRRTWAILAIALFAVAVLIWLARPRKSAQRPSMASNAVHKASPQQKTPAPVQNTAQTAATGGTAANQTRSEGAPPFASARVPAPPKAAAAMSSPRTRQVRRERAAAQDSQYINGPVWRVVIYTYDTAADAGKRVQLINQKHPDLKAEVFSPNGNAGPYLVVIGGQMARNDAVTLRQRALGLGLPRDTYIQNYKQ